MRHVRIDRLFLRPADRILQGMKKSFYEIEQEARRARAEELARLLRAGAKSAASLFKGARNLFSAKAVRHA
jgi:hypothetical protein